MTAPVERPPRVVGTSLGVPFDARRNGMNLVRLVLATSVLFHHSFPLLAQGEGPLLAGDHIGGWAVIGFFCLSGYLITASRRTKAFGEYLTLRIARIFPGFIVCLVVSAAVFAPISWWRSHGSLDGFVSTGTTPVAYVWNNITLKMNSWDVAGTPLDVPFPGAWNGSLWSLYYEFICYVIVGLLGCLALSRRSPIPVIVLWAVSVLWSVTLPRTAPYLGVGFDFEMLAKLLPYFLAGGVLYMIRHRLGMHPLAALAAAVLAGLALWISPAHGGQVASLCVAYVLLWISAVLPSPAWVRTHDISYGMYIYAFQVQQLVAVLGGAALGYWGFSLVALAATVPLALLSWFALERPIINAARRSLQKRPDDGPRRADGTPSRPDGTGAPSTDGSRTTS